MSDETGAVAQTGMRAERKVVTALFADLVGSTSLAERLDPEDVKLVMGDAVARIVTEIERLGGHVKDLAGDGVLAFFGAPTASEDDPERAIRAGLAISAVVSAYADEVERAWGVSGFGVRIGAATGPVVLGEIGAGRRVEYAAYGDTVNVAARLEAAAEPGTVLVDDATRQLVAPLFDWSEPLALELKGKAHPVEAYGVVGARAGAGKRRGLEGVATHVVGREPELAVALVALERLAAGSGGAFFVTGEAGIGKSRLLAEMRALAQSSDAAAPLWLEGRCVSYGESLTWWPFRDLLRDWLGIAFDDPELRARVALRRSTTELYGERAEEHYPYLASMLGLTLEPEAAAQIASLSPEALQYRTFEVVGSLLERLATDRPVVVAIEDLHWADATSIQLVEKLAPTLERAAVLVAATLRDERDHPSWRVRETARREYPHLTFEVALSPLSGDADELLLNALVGDGTLPDELERRLLATAEGNPFYLEELVRSLVDAGALAREDGRWRFDHEVAIEVPPTVEKVILARLDRLEPDHREVLTAASTLGRRFGLALLEAVVEDTAGVDPALHALQRLELVQAVRRWPQPEYRFKHVLIQEAAYGTLLREQRRRLHRRAAEWLEQRAEEGGAEELGLLAHHWLAAEDEGKAVEYLARAGDRARLEWALDEAIEHYRALLPLLERRGEQQAMAVVLFKLGLALHTALRFAEANAAYAEAFDLWSEPAAPARPSATLRIATPSLAAEPDPPRTFMLPDIQLQMALFDRLVERWPDATIVPSLAERWEVSDDGLRYEFRLREGLRWSDGEPLTAHDVEYGIKRSLDPARPGVSAAIYYVLENAQDYVLGRHGDAASIGVRALDDRTVEFRLAAPAPYFLSVVNRPDGGPQPRHAIQRAGDDWTAPEQAVVSGAFRQIQLTPDTVVLERREGATPRAGNVGRVELVRSSIDKAVDAYASGEVDLILTGPRTTTVRLMDTVGDDVELGPPAFMFYATFDHRNPLVRSLSLRRALAHAIDREAIAASLPPVYLPATGGIVPPALQGHTPDIGLRFEPDLARSLLEDSGLADELAVVAAQGDPLAALVAESWREVLGIAVEPAVIPLATFFTTEPHDHGPIALTGWFPGYPDPEYYLRLLLHSEASENHGHWSHSPFDELIERARREPDGRLRLELFHAADRMAVAEQVAVIPLLYGHNPVVVRPWVRGWWEYGKSWSSFADLLVDERAREAART